MYRKTRHFVSGNFAPKFDHFQYPADTSEAFKRGDLSADIAAELDKLFKADLLIFQVCIFRFYFTQSD